MLSKKFENLNIYLFHNSSAWDFDPSINHHLQIAIFLVVLFIHGRPQGGGKGGSWPAKNSLFLDFFEKNSMFLVVFRKKVCSCPPLENFCPPWKKVCGRPCIYLIFWIFFDEPRCKFLHCAHNVVQVFSICFILFLLQKHFERIQTHSTLKFSFVFANVLKW